MLSDVLPFEIFTIGLHLSCDHDLVLHTNHFHFDTHLKISKDVRPLLHCPSPSSYIVGLTVELFYKKWVRASSICSIKERHKRWGSRKLLCFLHWMLTVAHKLRPSTLYRVTPLSTKSLRQIFRPKLITSTLLTYAISVGHQRKEYFMFSRLVVHTERRKWLRTIAND